MALDDRLHALDELLYAGGVSVFTSSPPMWK
jgi:hypothetical protein